MFYALSWVLSFALLALWSLACWGLHAVSLWAVASAGALASGTTATLLIPGWLAGWIPPELASELQAMIAPLGPMVQAALQTVPALSGAVTLLAWALWGLGALTLLALAVGAHVLIAVVARRRTQPDPSDGASVR